MLYYFSMLNINIRLLSALGILTAVWGNSFPGSDPAIETRTIEQIYAAAQLESGELTVSWGGDGMLFCAFDPVMNSAHTLTFGNRGQPRR